MLKNKTGRFYLDTRVYNRPIHNLLSLINLSAPQEAGKGKILPLKYLHGKIINKLSHKRHSERRVVLSISVNNHSDFNFSR